MSITQTEFNQFVRSFNENYLELLQRAARGGFDDRLMQSFNWLKDTYEVIIRLHDLGTVDYEIQLNPLSLQGNHELLTQWGFDQPQIDTIVAFLIYYRDREGHGIDEILPVSNRSEPGDTT